MPSFASSIKKETISLRFFVGILIIGFLYISLAALLPNYKLVFQQDPITFKLQLLFSLILGIWESLSHVDFFLLLITSLFVGMNTLLIGKTIELLRTKKRVHFTIGGATIVALITTGCTSCGLSLLSVLGLSASVSFLPFKGLELHAAAIVLLILSSWYMLYQLHLSKYCKTPR